MAKKYIAVYEALKRDLHQKYPVGSLLPSEPELMTLYGASRTTIRHAVSLLRDEHLLEVRQGRGTQVLSQHYSYTNAQAIALFHNVSEIVSRIEGDAETFLCRGKTLDTIPAPQTVATQLGVPTGTLIYRLERILEANGVIFGFFKNYYRRELFPGLERYSEPIENLSNMYRFFEKKYGIYFESGKETITAQISSLFDAKLLGIDPGMPLLALHRIAYTKNHEIIEYAEKLIRPDIVQITVFMGGSPHYDD